MTCRSTVASPRAPSSPEPDFLEKEPLGESSWPGVAGRERGKE